ncbi:hypothetical protein LQZ21_12665 [Treponema sp. TIM-1]|uniref:hypothetical protein n=1 Tax=Treponema sp. TIM-1 TaxID=2898417 RepID=UPI0039809F26
MKSLMMNNYTVDVSIFLLDEDEFLKADEKRRGTLVKKVCRAIDGYMALCISLDNSVFFPKFVSDEFLQKLENNAFRKYSAEIEQLLSDGYYSYHDYKKKLQAIIDNYQREDEDYQQDWRRDFNNQFGIQNISRLEIKLKKSPENNIRKTYGENFIRTLSSIALLNKFIYDNEPGRHLFVYKGLDEELTIQSHFKSISFGGYLKEWIEVAKNDELNKIIHESSEFEGIVKKKSIKSIKETPQNFTTLEEAVKRAQHDFSNNLVFGNDIESGVKERNRDAGPPDKVYYYLKTLSEITGIKRTAHPDYPLVLLARMYGCNCSGQSEEIMYDDGGGKSGFVDHLKPAESKFPYHIYHSDDGHCIRIFFKWSAETKQTIVGWIGEHPDYGLSI